ncbi:hypothetical protein SAMN04488570_0177 [Nocardioides scoriae]|uniref:Uncharacterized protein n=1 Tax=Nocardioides scoriae TaxID=642780 RepID=A0A1H1LDY8_9ACTN|nr:hypothetical protein [Nocardioides scoriae]SDR72784.1 hypothetical protein SAMN04488570_0177 [Nocardioides scoriae]
MTDLPAPDRRIRWATHTGPDFLVLQLPPVPVVEGDRARDAMKTLLERRGFRPVVETDDLELEPANGCALTRTGEEEAELLLRIGADGASRIPLTDLDRAWLARVVEQGQAAVLLVEAAVRPDGTTSREDLRRDVDAGVVLAALVPTAQA